MFNKKSGGAEWIGRESSPKELMGNSFDLPGDPMSLISTMTSQELMNISKYLRLVINNNIYLNF